MQLFGFNINIYFMPSTIYKTVCVRQFSIDWFKLLGLIKTNSICLSSLGEMMFDLILTMMKVEAESFFLRALNQPQTSTCLCYLSENWISLYVLCVGVLSISLCNCFPLWFSYKVTWLNCGIDAYNLFSVKTNKLSEYFHSHITLVDSHTFSCNIIVKLVQLDTFEVKVTIVYGIFGAVFMLVKIIRFKM